MFFGIRALAVKGPQAQVFEPEYGIASGLFVWKGGATALDLDEPFGNSPDHDQGGQGEPHWFDEHDMGRDVRYDVQCMLDEISTHELSLRPNKSAIDSLLQRASSWRVLWQLESDSAAKMSQLDDGTLSVLIREQDLRDRNFDRAWVVLEST